MFRFLYTRTHCAAKWEQEQTVCPAKPTSIERITPSTAHENVLYVCVSVCVYVCYFLSHIWDNTSAFNNSTAKAADVPKDVLADGTRNVNLKQKLTTTYVHSCVCVCVRKCVCVVLLAPPMLFLLLSRLPYRILALQTLPEGVLLSQPNNVY